MHSSKAYLEILKMQRCDRALVVHYPNCTLWYDYTHLGVTYDGISYKREDGKLKHDCDSEIDKGEGKKKCEIKMLVFLFSWQSFKETF